MLESATRQRATAVRVAGWATVAFGGAIAVLRIALAESPDDGLEGFVGSLALGGAIAAPGVVAVLAPTGRWRLIGAGAALVLSIPLSFVTLPLIVPALIFVTHGARAQGGDAGRSALAAVLLAAAVLVLFASEDPRRAAEPGEGFTEVSDVISYAESAASLAAAAAAVAVAGRPRGLLS